MVVCARMLGVLADRKRSRNIVCRAMHWKQSCGWMLGTGQATNVVIGWRERSKLY